MAVAADAAATPHAGDRWSVQEGPLERGCRWLCALGLIVMVIVIAVEVATRALFHYSFEISDEVGGYLLVAISFLSLPVAQTTRGFHHVEFIQARLSLRGRAVSELVFDLLCLAGVVILIWQLVHFEMSTWNSGDVAPTNLATPLWLPQLTMPLGCIVLALSLVRSVIGDCRRLAALYRHSTSAPV